jgi:hypothetical protein
MLHFVQHDKEEQRESPHSNVIVIAGKNLSIAAALYRRDISLLAT